MTSQLKYVDTHCHLDHIFEKLQIESFEEYKSSHLDEKFDKCITISCEPEAIGPTIQLLEHPEIYASFGIHPHDAKKYTTDIEDEIRNCMNLPKCVAWGEIGLDYHYNFSQPEIQKEIFIRQIKQAILFKKPLIIHTREAEDDTLAIMKEYIPGEWKVHVHCFTSSAVLAKNLLNHFSNLYIGITGVVTFKNADNVREVLLNTPLEKLLLETDGPYMAPVPYRGKPAHPGHVPIIANFIADFKNIPIEMVYSVTRNNCTDMYGM